jgi:c-di-AMP phosphodiesterase-like protein
VTKYNRDRYFYLFEERYYPGLIEDKFSLLDNIHECVGTGGIKATLSIGIGKDGKSPEENFHFANLALDMALSRGGDQAVVKDRFNFDFFGGHSAEVEKWTKVKSRVMSNALGELISDASQIFVMGHKNADLDTIGAAVGISRIAHARGKKTRIVVDPEHNMAEEFIEQLRAHEEYAQSFITGADAIIEADSRSLLVVVDTNRPEEVESETLLLSCNSIAVIDHHRRAATYIENATLNFHEPYASSASELVTEMLQYLVEQPSILKIEAEALLAGIVLDTKSFSIHTGSRTFDAAAFLRRAGAETADVKKLLQSDFTSAVKRYSIVKSAVMYKEGIAIAISDNQEGRIVIAQAADELLNIAGIGCSFVLSPHGEDTFISGRSIGNVNVQLVLEKLGGGGNQATAGAQVKGAAPAEAELRLKEAIDEFISEIPYDENNRKGVTLK